MSGFMTLLSLSISGGILALLLFALKPIIRHRLSKSLQYYVWLIVLLRLVVPLSFEANLMNCLFGQGEPPAAVVQASVGQRTTSPADGHVRSLSPEPRNAIQPPAERGASIDFITLLRDNLSWIWLLGAAVSISYSIIVYRRFSKLIESASIPASEREMLALAMLREELRIRRAVRLFRSGFAPTPMLFGVFRPKIILPDAGCTGDQLAHVLRHELTHLRRNDIALKWLTSMITAVHWFNPVVYLVRREINRACELSCDEAVIKALDSGGKQGYGETLISVVAETRMPFGAVSTTMCEEKKTLKERLISIMKYKRKSKAIAAFSILLVAILTGCGLTLGANTAGAQTAPEFEKTGLTPVKAADARYNFSELEKYATPYVGNNSKVGAILARLPAPDSRLMQDTFELQTNEEPYGITANYNPSDRAEPISASDLDRMSFDETTAKNALVLFSLIDNLDKISFSFSFDGGLPSEQINYTREEFSLFGDLAALWSGEYTALSDAFFSIEAKSKPADDLRQEDIIRIIDENLDVIMSSPKESSMTLDYIHAHPAEYAKITILGDWAVPYLLEIAESDGGLRGGIAKVILQGLGVTLHVNSAISPDGKYIVETRGIIDSPISGIYPAREICISDNETGEVLWHMSPGYIESEFAWSPDSRYVAVYFMARTYGDMVVYDTKTKRTLPILTFDDLIKKFGGKFKPDDNRPDPYLKPLHWESGTRLRISYKWSGESGREYSGEYVYDTEKGPIEVTEPVIADTGN